MKYVSKHTIILRWFESGMQEVRALITGEGRAENWENCRRALALPLGHTHRQQCYSPHGEMVLGKSGGLLQLIKHDCMQSVQVEHIKMGNPEMVTK